MQSSKKISILNDIKIMTENLKDYRNNIERTRLIQRYIDLIDDELVNEIYYIINLESMLTNRSCDEQLSYIDKLIESKDTQKTNVIYLISNDAILENISYEEHIQLVDEYIKAKTDCEAYCSYLDAVNKVKVK